MFKKAKSFKLRENRESCTTLIAKGTRISGRVSFDGTLHIEGIVQGNINGESGLLTIANKVDPIV